MLDPPDRPSSPLQTSSNQPIQPTHTESQASSSTRRRPNRGPKGKPRGHGDPHRGVDQSQSHELVNDALDTPSHAQPALNGPAEAGSSRSTGNARRGGRGRGYDRGHRGGNSSHRFRANAADSKESDGPSTADENHETDASGGLDAGAQQPKGPSRNARRKQFGSKLTAMEGPAAPTRGDRSGSGHAKSHPSSKNAVIAPSMTSQSKDMDLTSRLTAAFSRTASPDDAPDCPICFSTIGPGQPTWSCSPTLDGSDILHVNGVSCWTSFHLKCIKSWATKSTKETREAYIAREVDQVGEWRCPGCQTRRAVVPWDYRCFCGRTVDPKPGRLSTPHSCGDACSRPRMTCEHPCPLSCHPGPCPPCLLTITQQCHCGSQTLTLRCSNVTASNQDPSKPRGALAPLSCGKLCGRSLSCGKHVCDVPCHPGPCMECEVMDVVKCYCGKEEQEMRCGDGDPKTCSIREDGAVINWEGQFDCHRVCDRAFDCDQHRCKKTCHPPSVDPAPCPRSPSLVTTCPCSTMPLSSLPPPPRTSCSDPIPTCDLTCSKEQPLCNHLCERKCHEGPCGRCKVIVEEKCRCGRIGRQRRCWEVEEAKAALTVDHQNFDEDEGIFTCDKKCTVLRNCGKHICGRICCPLAVLAGVLDGSGKGKKKQRDMPTASDLADLDPEGWHVCDLICNKRLACGNHNCTENDHRGPCPPCLQSSYDELTCTCRRTTIMPPVPCGTIMKCPYPCSRPPLACGHPKTPHNCHENEDGCPPCPFLTTKNCMCEKTDVRNVRCSQDKVSCGMACGKLLDCGFHSCDKLCHSGECGSCNQVCGKSRKLCLPLNHPCTQSCHAPSSCPESEPCKAIITLKCACGRIQQPATCGVSTASPTSRASQPLACLQECLMAKRNERLASALGISSDRSSRSAAGSEATFPESLQTFFRGNHAFAAMVEKNLNDFITSTKRMVVLAPMPVLRRKFVRELAEAYRLDTEEVDQEPRRSVQLLRRIDSRIPNPLLSAVARPPATSKPGGLVALKRSGTGTPPTIGNTSASSSSAPIKMAWGARPAIPMQNTGATATVPSASVQPLASFSGANIAPTVSRPQTPTSISRAPLPPSVPAVASESLHVPESWEEE